MKLSEEMKNKTLLSFELFPPKTEKGLQNLPGTIDHLMKYNPSYMSDDQKCRNYTGYSFHRYKNTKTISI